MLVFAGGFDLAGAVALNDNLDSYAVLDALESLVRKSLITVDSAGAHARYGMLETIRQFAEDQLAATATIAGVRDCHAGYYARQAVRQWEVWDGHDQRAALDWFDFEFANLRAGFRWAAEQSDLATARDHVGVAVAPFRTGRLGRRAPPCRCRRRSGAASAALRRGQLLHVQRPS
ncbi:MAG: hypothetical protein ACKV2O_08530 [Acidimicrobiales bacterium]